MDATPLDLRPAVEQPGRPSPEAGPCEVAVICNPTAGGGRHAPRLAAALTRLRQLGFAPALHLTRQAGDAERLARRAIRMGAPIVVAAGGDGTLNEVINGLGDTAATIALFPVGTTNVLAADIGLTGAPAQFAGMIAARVTRPFRAGIVNGRRFGVMASVGFDAQVVERVSPRLKRMLGKGAFILAAARHLLHYRPSTYDVVIDGEAHEASLVVVTRSRYYAGRYMIAPDSRIDCDEFHVCLLGGRRRRDLLRYALALPLGLLPRLRDVVTRPGRSIEIGSRSGRPEPVQADGDVVARLPATITLAPTPLRLIVPSGQPGAEGGPSGTVGAVRRNAAGGNGPLRDCLP